MNFCHRAYGGNKEVVKIANLMNTKDKKLWLNFCEISKNGAQGCPDDITLSNYIDGTLPKSDVEQIEDHLSECDRCLDIVSQIQLSDEIQNDRDYSDLNREIFSQIPRNRKIIFNIPFMRVATVAASLIALLFITVIMQSDNTKRNLSADDTIARVIELYNGNKYYKVAKNSVDGFAPSDKYSTKVRYNSHEADIDNNGKISMDEVLRYIAEHSPQVAGK